MNISDFANTLDNINIGSLMNHTQESPDQVVKVDVSLPMAANSQSFLKINSLSHHPIYNQQPSTIVGDNTTMLDLSNTDELAKMQKLESSLKKNISGMERNH